MSEGELGETRCVHWPRSCADAQAQCATAFQFCDFCLYGPPEQPSRSIGDGLSIEEAQRRIAETEKARGEKLRSAVLAATQPNPPNESPASERVEGGE